MIKITIAIRIWFVFLFWDIIGTMWNYTEIGDYRIELKRKKNPQLSHIRILHRAICAETKYLGYSWYFMMLGLGLFASVIGFALFLITWDICKPTL